MLNRKAYQYNIMKRKSMNKQKYWLFRFTEMIENYYYEPMRFGQNYLPQYMKGYIYLDKMLNSQGENIKWIWMPLDNGTTLFTDPLTANKQLKPKGRN